MASSGCQAHHSDTLVVSPKNLCRHVLTCLNGVVELQQLRVEFAKAMMTMTRNAPFRYSIGLLVGLRHPNQNVGQPQDGQRSSIWSFL